MPHIHKSVQGGGLEPSHILFSSDLCSGTKARLFGEKTWKINWSPLFKRRRLCVTIQRKIVIGWLSTFSFMNGQLLSLTRAQDTLATRLSVLLWAVFCVTFAIVRIFDESRHSRRSFHSCKFRCSVYERRPLKMRNWTKLKSYCKDWPH